MDSLDKVSASTAEDLKIIAENMKRRRKELHMTQEEVGRIAGMSAVNYGEVERGKRNITLETFAYIAFALDCRADILLKGTSFSDVLVGESPEITFKRIQGYLQKYGIVASIHPTFHYIDDTVPVTLTIDNLPADSWLIPYYEEVHNASLSLKEVKHAINAAEAETEKLYESTKQDYLLVRLQQNLFVKPVMEKLLGSKKKNKDGTEQ